MHDESSVNTLFPDVGSLSDFIATFNLTGVLDNPREAESTLGDNVLGFIRTNVWSAPPDPEDVLISAAAASPFNQPITMAHFGHYLSRNKQWLDTFHPSDPTTSPRPIVTNQEYMAKAVKDMITCFEKVPKIFFNEELDIEHPVIFDKVSSGSQWTKETLDKLQSYLDLVEVALMKQIFMKTDDFFETGTKLGNLRNDIDAALREIRNVRHMLRVITLRLIAPVLLISQRKRRLLNTVAMHEMAEQLIAIKKSASSIQTLLANNDYMRALKLIESTREMIQGDYKNLKCLQPTIKQLQDYQDLITSTLSSRFEALALNFNFLEETTEQTDVDDAELASQLFPIAQGLVQAGTIMEIFANYKSRIKLEIAAVVKTVVTAEIASPSSNPGSPVKASISSAGVVVDKLKAMSSKDFLSLIECVYEHLLLITNRVARVNTVLLGCIGLEVVKKAASESIDIVSNDAERVDVDMLNIYSSPAATPTRENGSNGFHDDKDLMDETNDVIYFTCEQSQKHVSKLLDARRDLHARYSIEDLYALWEATSKFTNETEKHSEKKVKTLVGVFLSQAQMNLELLHDTHMTDLAKELDSEEWKQATVSSDIQEIVNMMLSGELTSEYRTTSQTLRKLNVSGEDFRVVRSVQTLIRWIFEYLMFGQKFPKLATTVLSKLLFLLRLFNNRTDALILGAGARTLNVIHTINAKHLCLVSQCLGVIISLIPSVSHVLGSIMPPKQHVLLEDLEVVQNDFSIHQDKVHNKFVTMVGEVVDKSVTEALADKSWINDTKLPSPTPYINTILTTSQQLHKVLDFHLNKKDVLEIFSRVMILLGEKLPDHFRNVEPRSLSSTGKQRIIGDITYLVVKLREIGPLREMGHNLERHFRSRYGS